MSGYDVHYTCISLIPAIEAIGMTESQALPDESAPYEFLTGMATITVKVVQPSLTYQEYRTSTKQHNNVSLVINILNSACRLGSRLRRS